MKRISLTKKDTFILGAGVTGLACGYASGYSVFEKNNYSGGICSSYYISMDGTARSTKRRDNEEDYRFEYGGGHWIFGNNGKAAKFLGQFDTLKKYNRKSSVYLGDSEKFIPFPLQNSLRYLPSEVSQKILTEIMQNKIVPSYETMYEWCEVHFGKTLSELFFHPFHDLYTAGLWKTVQPQDGYKSPINITHITEGARADVESVGYNVSFVYPEHGLSALTSGIEQECSVQYNKEVVHIDVPNRVLKFQDSSVQKYSKLVSTLPLNVMQNLTGLRTKAGQDPYTSVLVLNIGAKRGPKIVDDQWIYFPQSVSGFHRIGFYNNVDINFLPLSMRNGEFVSLYVEKSFRGGEKPSEREVAQLKESVVKELRALDFISDVDVCDPTWIDIAYTWSYPRSSWREEMITQLKNNNIIPVGRYATWKFQGILDSINDGLLIGSELKG